MRRVVRRIELWSVLKVSLAFNAVMLGVALAAVALLWALANSTGLVDDFEGFLRESGFEDFRFQGDRMFRQVGVLGALVALAFTVFTVLSAALINLISEITGGIRFVVIEELVPPQPTRAPRTQPQTASPSPTQTPSPFPRVEPLPPATRPQPSGALPASWPGALPSPRPPGDRPGGPSGRGTRRD